MFLLLNFTNPYRLRFILSPMTKTDDCFLQSCLLSSGVLDTVRSPSMRITLTLLLLIEIRNDTSVEVVQRFELGILVEEYVSFDEPRQPGTNIVLDEPASWYGEDVIELLEGSLLNKKKKVSDQCMTTGRPPINTYLGLWNPQEDHKERNHIQTREETESTGWRKCFEDLGECQAQYCSPEKTCCNSPTHACWTVSDCINLRPAHERPETTREHVATEWISHIT